MVIFLLAFLLAATATEVGLQEPLELKGYLDAPKPWFPGQAGRILYQIKYRGKIQLTDEQLPMLDPEKGFEKVGDKVIEEHTELNYNVQNIYQKIRPTQSGHFVFPPSRIEGFIYEIRAGNIVPTSIVKSDLPQYEVDVTPFPTEGQPPLFNGSVGSFDFALNRVGEAATQAGDWITLAWSAKGPELSGLRLPNLACLPGLVGFFRLNDLPIVVSQNEDTKTFTFQISPLVSGITEIPSLSWPVYDPKKNSYFTWKSAPIPLTNLPLTPRQVPLYPSKPLYPLVLPDKTSNQLLQEGEIPLALLVLHREWRNQPWSFALPKSIHAIEERAGLPLSDFPLVSFILKALQWLLIPFTLFALWKRSIPLLATALALSIFLLWWKETEAVVLSSYLTKQDSSFPFLAGEIVKVHSEDENGVLISSKKQIGYISRRALIDI